MPRPVFIICSQGMAKDELGSKALSIFHVLEGFTFTAEMLEKSQGETSGDFRILKDIPGVPMGPMFYMNAVWMRTDEKPDDKFQYDVGFTLPGGTRTVIHTAPFSFSKIFYRMTAGLSLPFEKLELRSGTCTIDCRVKKDGDSNWLSQEFPIPITVILPQAKATPSETSSA